MSSVGLLRAPRAARSVGLSEPILPRIAHKPGAESRETCSVVPEGPAPDRSIQGLPAHLGSRGPLEVNNRMIPRPLVVRANGTK